MNKLNESIINLDNHIKILIKEVRELKEIIKNLIALRLRNQQNEKLETSAQIAIAVCQASILLVGRLRVNHTL
jgi:hypothetical protein